MAVAHARYERAEDLLRDADIALYRSKADGRATYTIFNEVMHDSAVRRLQISSDVRDAINAPEQFRVAFQPLVRLSDWKTVGYEALVRWQHPREGLLQPDLFIPAAEETGVIVRLGREVLARSLERLAREQRYDPTLTMHVNVSVQEIMHGDLPEHVFAAIKASRRAAGIGHARDHREHDHRHEHRRGCGARTLARRRRAHLRRRLRHRLLVAALPEPLPDQQL